MLEKSTRASNWQLLEPKRPQLARLYWMDGTGLCSILKYMVTQQPGLYRTALVYKTLSDSAGNILNSQFLNPISSRPRSDATTLHTRSRATPSTARSLLSSSPDTGSIRFLCYNLVVVAAKPPTAIIVSLFQGGLNKNEHDSSGQ